MHDSAPQDPPPPTANRPGPGTGRLPEELEGAARSPSPEIGLEHGSNVSQECQPGRHAADSLALAAPTTVVRTDAECPVPPVPSSLATVGSWPSLPGYAILDILGRGGMGVVYKALQVGLNRLVALKMIVSGVHAGPEELARFRREAEAVAGLRHPNIVQIYEIGELDGVPFFSLELADGGSLADRLDGTPQPARAAAELVETLARAVHAAHECGIVHRDLKPANILLSVSSDQRAVSGKKPERAGLDHHSLVTDDCTPKITDFGLAKRLDIEVGQTKTGAVIGTPSYMAPEQAAGRTREIGRATDVYALGAMLYELLTGRPPFRAETALETARQVIYVEPVSPRRLQPRVPRDLETICLKCLAKEPRKRYACALALAEDLHRYLGGEPIQARPATPWERAIKWTKRRPALAALIAATCVAVLSLFAFSAEHLHQRARDAERELGRHLQLEKLRGDVQDLLSQVRQAIAAREWSKARTRQREALAMIGDKQALEDLKAQAEDLGEKINRHESTRGRYHQLGRRRRRVDVSSRRQRAN